MLLIGLTLVVQVTGPSSEEKLPVTLAIQSSFDGGMEPLRDVMKHGTAGTYDIEWIEDKLYLQLHPSLDVSGDLPVSSGAKPAEHDETSGVTALDPGH